MKLRNLTLTAVLTAGALVTFVIENQIPPLTAIPGIKLGLSNIFTLFTLFAVGVPEALSLLLVRVVLGSVITGQASALLYSMAGGILAFAVMLLLRRVIPEKQLWVISVFAAMAHNLGQIAAAVLLTGTKQVFYYLPVLLLAAIGTGAFTGICAQTVLKRLQKSGQIKSENNREKTGRDAS